MDESCANCGRPIGPSDRYPTGWTHVGDWQGVRCSGRVVGALPVGELAKADLRLLAAAVQFYSGEYPGVPTDVREAAARWVPRG